MGMDVYIDGELTIPAAKVSEARDLFLKELAKGDKCTFMDEEWVKQKWNREPWTPDSDEPVETPEEFVELLEDKFDSFGVNLESDGSLTFGMSDSCRHEEYDEWIFEALAPTIDDGEFYMSGDDCHWKWIIKDGVLTEHDSETVYDHDDKAVPVIEKIIALIYPADRNGLPFFCNNRLGYESVVDGIENLLRENGYGPQAGMSELDRLSEV